MSIFDSFPKGFFRYCHEACPNWHVFLAERIGFVSLKRVHFFLPILLLNNNLLSAVHNNDPSAKEKKLFGIPLHIYTQTRL